MTQTRQGFITGGTWCLDCNLTIDRWPDEETATRILSADEKGGGSSCNFAVDMRRLAPEIPVSTIGLCGDDADGQFLRDVAARHGIDITRFTVTPGLRTHRTMAFTSLQNGRRTHIFEADSSDHMTPDHFDFTGSDAWMLHLGLPGTHALLDSPWQGDANGWVTVLKKARAAGLKTNLEIMSVPRDTLLRLNRPCLPQLDFLVVNDYEIGALADVQTIHDGQTSVADVTRAARAVLEQGAMELVVIHFPGGAVAVERNGTVHVQPSVNFPRDQVRGANGAGDAFAAGFFCGLHKGRPLQECLVWAHASAAASLRSVDTYSSMEPIEACLQLAERHGWRDGAALGQPGQA